ncbi:glucan biosynthesis protein G [Glaciimonas sp. Gout2]|nr:MULTISPECIES: glucan biosynthesis protein G [unclassified Glaciimonas]MDY7547084.1 glucan biosynthesis protein G [Glaciimonas sp. CA11.2]MEB0011072.1 glucan biosynthesis protein G [Glaciimonas sp. Cout2]MEB0081251.1 glucan biosynthesis protein G [Glaciimonas sp. Gout2]
MLAPALIIMGCLLPIQYASAFNFNDVAQRAKALSAKAYVKPVPDIPKEVDDLTLEQYRDIRFKSEKSPWASAKLPFDLAFFHEGHLFNQPVKMNEILGKNVREIRFDPNNFTYGANKIDPSKLRGLGFAGFRVHYPLNNTSYKDEVLSFLGASYFRAIGKDQRYGLSARGLAVDTALNSGEEFPQFVEFWIERPKAGDKQLTIYALLNSRRVTGAYSFILKPGVDTAIEVKAQLYLRENVSKLGIAPLTSMFLYGKNQRSPVEDYRPEVHDSDGLLVASGTGEWIWRPLVNPKRLLVTSYTLSNPIGFGLMQRERNFAAYQDLSSRYEKGPSAWVQPKGKWGSGRVELVQIPTPDETNDNIVAYWVPDTPPKVGQPFNIEYTLLWQKDAEKSSPLSWVTQTRRGNGFQAKPDDSIGLLVDFEGPAFKKLPENTKLDAVVSVDDNGKLLSSEAVKNEATGGWRINIKLRRNEENKPVEIRAFLRNANTTLSETWSYILPPN